MKRFIALLVSFIMLLPCISLADGIEEKEYVEDRVLWSSDFEVWEHGESPSGRGNSNAVTPTEWITVPTDTGGSVIEDELTGNKYYRFYNNGTANVTQTFMQTFNMTTQDFRVFKIEFDVKSNGIAFNARWKTLSKLTYFVNLSRNASRLYSKAFLPTQWNHIEIIVDDNKNLMKIKLNGLLAYENVFQTAWEAKKTLGYFYFSTTLFPGDELLFDNMKLTTLIPEYDVENIEKPENVEEYFFTPAENGIPEIRNEGEKIGYAAWNISSTRTQGGMTPFGHRTYVVMNADPSYINEFDTLTGEYITSFDVPEKSFYYSFQPASDGKMHHTNGEGWYTYDPKTGKSTLFKSVFEKKTTTAWGMNPGADDNRDYFYTAHSAGTDVVEYNIKTGEFRIFDDVSDGMKYLHAATGNDKYIFATAGDDGGTERAIRLDKETGERKIWYNDHTDITAGNMPHCIVVGDKLFTSIRSWVFCIDTNTMTEFAKFETGARGGRQRISYTQPGGDPDLIYYLTPNQVGLNSFNLKTGEIKESVKKFNESKEGLGAVEFGEWIQKKDGTWAIYACVEGTHAALITPGDPEIEYIELTAPGRGFGDPVSPDYYHVSRDDILYTGGFRAGVNAVDLKDNTPLFSVKQNSQHGITEVNGMIFCGTYSSGYFYMIDPEKPAVYKTDNPKFYYESKFGCRHYNASTTNAGFCMHCAITDYGGDNGGVVLSTYANGKPMAREYGAFIPVENITGQCYKDGYIYAASTVIVNLHEPHEEAHIAKINARTGEPVIVKSYDIPDVGPIKVYGEPVMGPDGYLYAIANQGVTLLCIDPENMELVRYKSYYKQRETTNTVLGDLMIMGADGVIYNSMGDQLHAINIETLEAVLLHGNCTHFTLDNYGNIIKNNGNNSAGNDLIYLTVNQRQRLDVMIKNAEKYFKEEEFSKTSWKIYQNALADAKKIDLYKDSDEKVKEAAKKLTFAIKDLQTKYDEEAGFAYVFGDNMAAFADMTGYEDTEALHAVNMLKHSKIINGINNKTFAPDKSITRAEFVKILSVIEGCDDEIASKPYSFTDVTSDKWYYDYVQIAYEKGWINGKTETEFAPDDIITEEQMITILNRIKPDSFDEGEDKKTTRAEAAKILYDYINK